MIPFWISVDEAILAQGDYLPGCRVPVFAPDFDTADRTTVELDKADLIISSLPFSYLTRHAEVRTNRHRLQSPFLEHFSQAFARFFMRVGLPSSIPAYE